jgi:predicted permease
VPLGLRADRMQQRDNHPGIYVVGLLKQGVTEKQARADMRGVAERLAQEYPKSNRPDGFTLVSLQDQATRDVSRSLVILMGAVVFVLLIACANVANLLLARAASRSKEIAIRTALGAGRARIIRQLLTESLLLSLAGGALGLLLAAWGIDALLAAVSDDVPRLILNNIRLDSLVILVTLLVSVATGLLFGLAPAILISKSNLNETLKEGGRGGSEGALRHHVRNFLVVAEIAVSLLLLVGAGLLVKSFLNLRQAELGFEPDRVLTMRLALPEARYQENGKIENFFNDLLARVKALPGVEGAGLTIGLPMNGGIESGVTFEGQEVTDTKDITVAVNLAVSPEYFETMRMPLVEGRYFTAQDREGAPRVAIIDEMMAARFSPHESAVGKRIRLGGGPPPPGQQPMPWMQIVGVVKHLRYYGPSETARVELYRPFFQLPLPADSPLAQGQPVTIPRGASLAVRPGRADRLDPQRRPRHRSRSAHLRRADDERDRGRHHLSAEVRHVDARPLRRGRPRARRPRHLRRDGLLRDAAHARDRHPHGARREPQGRAQDGGRAGDEADAAGGRGRARRLAARHAPDDGAALRREGERPAHLRRRGPPAGGRRAALLPAAGAPRHQSRSDDRAPLRVMSQESGVSSPESRSRGVMSG